MDCWSVWGGRGGMRGSNGEGSLTCCCCCYISLAQAAASPRPGSLRALPGALFSSLCPPPQYVTGHKAPSAVTKAPPGPQIHCWLQCSPAQVLCLGRDGTGLCMTKIPNSSLAGTWGWLPTSPTLITLLLPAAAVAMLESHSCCSNGFFPPS